MKILWLTNIILPEASQLLNETPNPFGGWLVNASRLLAEQDDISLFVAFPRNGTNETRELKGKEITYFPFKPLNKVNDFTINKQLETILDLVNPDIVHIYGTEYKHSLMMVNICNKKDIKCVIAIQGLVSIYAKHYMASLPERIQNRYSIRDLLKRDNLKQQQKKFIERGKLEIEAIKSVKHVIGRTTWDKACTIQINPNVKYHYCNETLREEFYNRNWSLENCEKHSIFISQAGYPIKGLHIMLDAMPIILKRFPDAKLYIAGPDITKKITIKDRLKKSSFELYIIQLINKYKLKDNVLFTGLLNEKQMCERYLNTHVFVSPSIVENESNSLSEAKILGVPCVASYVGGVVDRINDKADGFFYQFDAPYMLAYYVCELFRNDELALNISKNAKFNAQNINDRQKNVTKLIEIYKIITSSK